MSRYNTFGHCHYPIMSPTDTVPDYNAIRRLSPVWNISTASLSVRRVIFNPPATIVLWSDGTKTVVKCSKNDYFDKEKGLAMAILKRMSGNNSIYFDLFRKWCKNKDSAMKDNKEAAND